MTEIVLRIKLKSPRTSGSFNLSTVGRDIADRLVNSLSGLLKLDVEFIDAVSAEIVERKEFII